jgi:hypothetical protein
MAHERSERARWFIRRYLRTIEQLEVLLLVARTPDRYWSAAEAASALQLPSDRVAGALEQLAAANLLDVRLLDDVRYKYSPTAEDRALGVADLEEEYARDRVGMISELIKRRSGALVEFADAFRLRREDEDNDG